MRKHTLEFPVQRNTPLNREEAQNILPLVADVYGLERNIRALTSIIIVVIVVESRCLAAFSENSNVLSLMSHVIKS